MKRLLLAIPAAIGAAAGTAAIVRHKFASGGFDIEQMIRRCPRAHRQDGPTRT